MFGERKDNCDFAVIGQWHGCPYPSGINIAWLYFDELNFILTLWQLNTYALH